MKQSTATMRTRFYRLEPGDSTRYEFSLTWNKDADGFIEDCDRKEHYWLIHADEAVRGLSKGFVLITIRMPYWQGSYTSHISHLKHLSSRHVAYIATHMRASRELHTVAAVLLAAGVLVDDPHDLRGACKAMLKASEILTDLHV